jgi:hypothetical protein
LHDYPPGFLPLHLAATVAALVFWWLRRILLPLELFAGRGADHLPAIPQEHEQPLRAWAVIDADRVGAAAAAIRAVLEESIRPGSPRVPADGYFRYPPIHYLQLEALPQVRMIDAESMDEMARGLVHGVEMLRQASIHYDDPIQRYQSTSIILILSLFSPTVRTELSSSLVLCRCLGQQSAAHCLCCSVSFS